MEHLGAWRTLIHEKKPEVRVRLPLNGHDQERINV
jgi:hypothetical protein